MRAMDLMKELFGNIEFKLMKKLDKIAVLQNKGGRGESEVGCVGGDAANTMC
jgi:hypothetical protein